MQGFQPDFTIPEIGRKNDFRGVKKS